MEPTAFDADLRSGVTTVWRPRHREQTVITSSLSGTESMYFAKLGWADEEVEKLFAVTAAQMCGCGSTDKSADALFPTGRGSSCSTERELVK